MPVHDLSVRGRPVGGPVARDVTPPPERLPLVSSRLVLLIHGYNNTEADARSSYDTFLKTIDLPGNALVGLVCAFFWPGDAAWGGLSGLSYPIEIGTARDAAGALHRFLARLRAPGGWPIEVVLVGHSLGCRLVLELASRFVSAGRPGSLRYRAACLMAAAVPVPLMESALRPAAVAIERTVVLHSTRDTVLRFAFPIGETAAGEGFFPRAVGRYGEPRTGLWSERAEMQGYEHGDYWARRESAEAVAGLLGLTVPRRPAAASLVPARGLPLPGGIASRRVRERSISARVPGRT